MNNSSVQACPMDALEKKMLNLFLQVCNNLESVESINNAVAGVLATSSASEQEKENFSKVIAFFTCMTELVKADEETFQDLQDEYQSYNHGILP
jgi:hypothetical protein